MCPSFYRSTVTPSRGVVEQQLLDADAILAFGKVGVFFEERCPVDELHRGERRQSVTGRHSGADRVRVYPADRQHRDATTQALRVRRLGRQRQVAADVVRTGVARLEPEAQDASMFQPVVVDRVRVKAVREPVHRRLVRLATRHCDVEMLLQLHYNSENAERILREAARNLCRHLTDKT